MRSNDERPIGIFDSGFGGVSVLREIAALLPEEELLYLGDNAHAPYGGLDEGQIRRRTLAAVDQLLDLLEDLRILFSER